MVRSNTYRRLANASLVLVLASATVLGTATAASATSAYRVVAVTEGTGVQGEPGTTIWHGVKGSAYCSNVSPASGSFMVRSIWATTYSGSAACETGWCDHNQSGQPSSCTLFVQLVKNYAYLTPEHLGTITSGTNQTFQANWNGVDAWQFYYAGNLKATRTNTGITSAVIGSQSEAHDTTDSLWAHWWSLKRYKYAALTPWTSWVDLRLNNDNSSTYRLSETSNSEYYVVLQ